MKSIGIKLADGSFYPILEEGTPGSKNLNLTTVQDNQTTVHVDLYRSETNSMDDAEYVDTLEIKNLNPHENGEPTLDLQIDLDEHNELSAKVRDLETGKNSETTVTLLSRTLSDRNSEPVNFNIDEPVEPVLEPTVKDEAANTDNTLADDAIIDSSDFELPADILNDLPSQESSGNQEEASDLSDIAISDDELSLLGISNAQNENEDTQLIGPSPNDEEFSFDEISQSPATEQKKESSSDDIFTDDFALPDFGSTASDESSASEEPGEDDSNAASIALGAAGAAAALGAAAKIASSSDNTEDDIQVSIDEPVTDDIEVPVEESVTDDVDVPVEEAVTDEITSSEDNTDFSLPDFDDQSTSSEDISLDGTDTADFSLPDFDNDATQTSSGDADFSLPDFDDEDQGTASVSAEDTVEDETTQDFSAGADDFSLPDFDDTPSESKDTLSDDFSLPDFDDSSSTDSTNQALSASPVGLDGVFDDDFGEVNLDTEDDDLKTKDPTFEPKNDMFSDLYDKETIEGSTSYEEAEVIKKKTRKPVIICIVCAIICIIAVLLLLFIIPSPINLLKKNKTETVQTAVIQENETLQKDDAASEEQPLEAEPEADLSLEPVTDEEVPPPVEEAKPAVEDAIVVAKPLEVVVPEVPVKVKKDDITYKIKWGDTLWDICAAYYKNPWRYKFLARYNNIRNPDKIISGRYLKIPQD